MNKSEIPDAVYKLSNFTGVVRGSNCNYCICEIGEKAPIDPEGNIISRTNVLSTIEDAAMAIIELNGEHEGSYDDLVKYLSSSEIDVYALDFS